MVAWIRRFTFPLVLLGALVAFSILRPAADRGVAGLARLEPPRYRPGAGLTDAEGPETATFREGVAAYSDGRWDAAAERFAAAGAENAGTPRAQEAALYEGLSHLFAGRAEAALPPLALAAQSEVFETSILARWFTAQAHLVRNDVAAARPLLEELSHTPAYARAASEQLLRLRGR